MKRIRTIFVALVILLVSMTMALGAGAATPLDPAAGTESTGTQPPGGSGDDGFVPLLGETDGDPDDGLEGTGPDDGAVKPGSGDSGFIGWAATSDGSGWSGLLDLWIVLQVVLP